MPASSSRPEGARAGTDRAEADRTGTDRIGAGGAEAPARTRKRRGGRPSVAAQHRAAPYLYLLPALLVYGAFSLWPLLRAFQFSFFDWDGLGASTFVGLQNYVELAGDEQFRASLWHALVLIGFYAVLPVVIGLVLAAVLNRGRVRGLGFFRTAVFLPQVVALVVVAVAWKQIYASEGGLNQMLSVIGLDGITRAWLGDYTWALPAVGLIGTWIEVGLCTLLLLAGMGRIPKELFEAVRLDGAGAVREFFAVTLPAVRGEIAVALTLTIIAALKTFDLIYMTTSGGPGFSTTVPSYEVYQRAFELREVGSAAAVGIVLTAMIFAINVVVNRLGDRDATE